MKYAAQTPPIEERDDLLFHHGEDKEEQPFYVMPIMMTMAHVGTFPERFDTEKEARRRCNFLNTRRPYGGQ